MTFVGLFWVQSKPQELSNDHMMMMTMVDNCGIIPELVETASGIIQLDLALLVNLVVTMMMMLLMMVTPMMVMVMVTKTMVA